MAISTFKTFLMHKVGDNWTPVCDIKSFPALGGAPEMLDTTTLSNKMRTYIAGIQSTEALEFTANYDSSEFTTLSGYTAEKDYAVYFGATEGAGGTFTGYGSDGKFEFKGYLSVHVDGGAVNEVQDMVITIAPSTEIKKAT